jgi:hypothetical protein
MKYFVIFRKTSEVDIRKDSRRIWGVIWKIPEEMGRNTQFFGNLNGFEPKTAIFPNQKQTNPEISGNILGSIRNAPEVKCRKIASLVKTITWQVISL